MPRKKSIRHCAATFNDAADNIASFLSTVSTAQSDQHISWLHNYSIIKLYREFETLVLDALVGAINNDTETIAATVGIDFPKHLTDEVCQFLIVGTGYFDFRGRAGLIGTFKRFIPDDHYLVTIIKKSTYKGALEQLAALRNFATHESPFSKKAALAAIEGKRIESSGAWLKCEERFEYIRTKLKELALEIKAAAPY